MTFKDRPADQTTQYWFGTSPGELDASGLRVLKLIYCVDRPTETLGVGPNGVPLRDEWAVLALETLDGQPHWRYTARWDYTDWLKRFARLPNLHQDYRAARLALIEHANRRYAEAQAALEEAGRRVQRAACLPEHFTIPEASGP